MKRLVVLRHAKSSWEDDSLADHERPLTERGRRAATAIGRWALEHDLEPHHVICSTAARARETLELILPALRRPSVAFDPTAYLASPQRLLALVRGLPDVDTALLVGHNPGLQRLILLLAAPSPERDRVASKLPTGALASLTLDVARWNDVGPGSATIADLVVPRELP